MFDGMKQVDFANDNSFLGHPKGLRTTSVMQAMYAFSHYGLSAILVFYLYANVKDGGLGFDKGLAAQLTSIYVSMFTIAGIVGSYVADRFIGVRKAILIAWIFRVVAFTLLIIPNGGIPFYVGNQCLLLISSACIGQSLYALVGKMYSKTEPRRDAAFNVMYVMNNVGTISPLIAGALGEKNMWPLAFSISAASSLIGLLLYIFSQKSFGDIGLLPDDPAPKDKKTKMLVMTFASFFSVMLIALGLLYTGVLTPSGFVNAVSTIAVFIPFAYIIFIAKSNKTTPVERKKILPFVIVFIASCSTLTIWGLAASIFLVFAESRVENVLFGFRFSPAAWITISSFFSITFGSLVGSLWTKLGDRQPSVPIKFGVGTMIWGVSAMFLAFQILLHGDAVKISGLIIWAFWAILIFGESITSPLGFGFSTSVAPKAFSAQMVTVWQLGLSTGAAIASLSINLYKEGQEFTFFFGNGVIVVLVGLALVLLSKPINKIISAD